MKKKSLMKIRKIVVYVEKNFVQTKIIKNNLSKSKKSEIMIIIQKNIEELFIVIAIYAKKTPREIPVIFHNGSTYDYHFIIKKLAKEFKGNFDCLGENTEKYITLSTPIKKDHDNDKAIIYKLKFIDSYRFMDRSLASLVDNLSEINKKKLMDEFIDNFRSMLASLSCHLNDSSEINKKIRKSENKYIDNLRSMSSSLSCLVDDLSEINEKKQKMNLFIALDLCRRYY